MAAARDEAIDRQIGAQVRERIDRVIDETAFSGVVELSGPDGLVHQRAAGLADRAHGIPNELGTRFALASATKGFTALAVMSLVHDGALGLDTPVRSLLGDELDLIDPAVTVEHLLAHTSGIGDYIDEDLPGDIGDYVMTGPLHQLDVPAGYLAALGGHPTKFAPGEQFSYSNGGFVVLALVVEAASGTSYYDVVADRVCGPAGIRDTAFLRSDQLPGSAALGYLPADVPPGASPDQVDWRTNQLHMPVRGCGDGGAYSTLADLAAFWDALFAGRILPSAVVDEMIRPRNDVPDLDKRYGMGFWLRPDRGTVMLEGYDAGVSCRSASDPASGWRYTVISNTSPGAWPLVELLDDAWPELIGA